MEFFYLAGRIWFDGWWWRWMLSKTKVCLFSSYEYIHSPL